MTEFPHQYKVRACAGFDSEVEVSSEGLESIPSGPPPEFGGPGNRWSPETLLVASVADCFILSFRAIARASKLSWQSLECEASGVLDRIDGSTRFTVFTLRTKLEVPENVSEKMAQRLLEKAEKNCLITNSLSAEVRLEASVRQQA